MRPTWKKSRLRISRRLLILLVVLIVLAGHVWFHYLPRERTGTPSWDDLPGDLLTRGRYDTCLWLPYPHQNLGTVVGWLDDPDAYLAAASRAAGVPPPRFTSFGPFRAPPAKEMVLAGDLEGGRFAAVARVYPTIAFLARLAGKVASNPWLGGGEVELEGRAARVRWEGTLWIVEPAEEGMELLPGELAADMEAPADADEKALAHVVLTRRVDAVPPGSYRFRRTEGGFVLAGAGADAGAEGGRSALPAADPAAADPGEGGEGAGPLLDSLVVAVYDAGYRLRQGGRAAVLFPPRAEKGASGQGGSARARPVIEITAGGVSASALPGVAVLAQSGRERWDLPGERVLSILGRDVPTAYEDGWQVVSYEEATLEAARALPGAFDALQRERRSRGAEPLTHGLWVAPRPARQVVIGVAEVLAAVPFVGKRKAERWWDWAVVLEPLDDFRRIEAETGSAPGSLVVRMVR